VKIEITTKELVEAIKGVEPAVAKRPYSPILSGVRLEAYRSGLSLETTDLDLTIQFHAECTAGEAGVVVVPAKQMSHAAKAMNGPTVTIESDPADGPSLSLSDGIKTINIETLSAEDWPTGASRTGLTKAAAVEARDLAEALSRVATCASNDEGRPVLTGVQFVFDAEEASLELVATDSYRLGIATLEVQSVGEISEQCPIVSARSLKAMSRQLFAKQSPVSIYASGGEGEQRYPTIEFRFGVARWTMRQIDGEFPNWRRIVPDENKGGSLEFDPKELGNAVTDAAGLRSDKSIPVRVALGTICSLRMIDGQVGKLSQELRQAAYSPNGTGPMEIAFNPTFLRDAIDFVGAERANLRVTDPCKPALFLGASKRRCVLMPVRTP
jgi:DNA polymerase III subunit beta